MTADRPLRILYHHRIAAADGMRVHIAELVDALVEQGHIVRIVGPAGAEEKPRPANAGSLESTADALRKILPGAVFELLELAYNLPAYARLKREADAFQPDVIYERFNLYLLAGMMLARRRRLPMILEINSQLSAERAKFGKLHLKGLARRCETALWRFADAVLPVTEVLAKDVRRVRGNDSDVHVIHNGANLKSAPDAAAVARIREQLSLGEDALVLGFVGFVRDWHGVGWALDAMAELPANTHLVIVGDGPALPQLESRAIELGLSGRTHFVGRVDHHAVPAYTECFDIALQTASVAYASPLKLFEYMGRARAIIAPDQPNIREVLTHEADALLFMPGDAAAFTAALKRLCDDESLRQRLGENALKTVAGTPFTWARNAERVAEMGRRFVDQRA